VRLGQTIEIATVFEAARIYPAPSRERRRKKKIHPHPFVTTIAISDRLPDERRAYA
jgi:hypothetical protein